MVAIEIVPLNSPQEEILEVIKVELKNRGFIPKVYAKMEIPKACYNLFRKQYHSGEILNFLTKFKGKILAIMKEDLYDDRLNFVFGDFDLNGNVVVSYCRLKPEFYQEQSNFELMTERLLKNILYFLARSLGMEDCENVKCIMHKPDNIKTIDFKTLNFCDNCKIKASVNGISIW